MLASPCTGCTAVQSELLLSVLRGMHGAFSVQSGTPMSNGNTQLSQVQSSGVYRDVCCQSVAVSSGNTLGYRMGWNVVRFHGYDS